MMNAPAARRPRAPWLAPVSVLLVFATVACTFIPSPLATTSFRAASFVPSSTWLFTSVSFRPSLTQAMNAQELVERFTSQPGFDEAWSAFTGGGLDMPDGLDFEQDVLPLLDGEVALAVFGELTPETEPLVLALVETGQPDALLAVIAQDAPLTTLPAYRSATFLQFGFDSFAALVDGWLLLAPSRGILEAAVDLVEAQGRGGLAAQSRYQSIASRLVDDKLAMAYVDTAPIAELVLGASDLSGLPPSFSDLLGSSGGRVAMSFAAAPGGLDVRTENILDAPLALPRTATGGNARAAFERVPASSLLAVTGNDLPDVIAQLEQGFRLGLESASRTGSLPGELAGEDALPAGMDLETLLADLPADLGFTRQFSGDYALGVGLGSVRLAQGEPTGLPDVTFAGRVSNPAAVAADVRAWEALFPPKAVQTLNVGGATIQQVFPEPDQSLAWGVVGDWLYLLTGDPRLALAAPSQGGVTRNPRFGLVQETFTTDGTNVFVDLEGGRLVGESFIARTSDRAEYERTVQPLVTPFKALASATTMAADGSSSGRLFIAIGE